MLRNRKHQHGLTNTGEHGSPLLLGICDPIAGMRMWKVFWVSVEIGRDKISTLTKAPCRRKSPQRKTWLSLSNSYLWAVANQLLDLTQFIAYAMVHHVSIATCWYNIPGQHVKCCCLSSTWTTISTSWEAGNNPQQPVAPFHLFESKSYDTCLPIRDCKPVVPLLFLAKKTKRSILIVVFKTNLIECCLFSS